jgi:hypothetical protein
MCPDCQRLRRELGPVLRVLSWLRRWFGRANDVARARAEGRI